MDEEKDVQQEQEPVSLMQTPVEDAPASEEMQHQSSEVIEGEDLEGVTYERPEEFPENFWDEKEGPDIDGLVKSYNELRTKMSQGKHKAPDEYDTSSLENVSSDDPLLETYASWAKDNGISQGAFEELAKAFIEAGYTSAQASEVNMEAERAALGNNADEIIRSNINWGKGLVSKGILSEDDYEELEIWGGTASGQRLLQKFRGMMGEKQIPTVSIEGQALDKEELRALVADPRYKSDIAFRNSVEQKFNQAYPDQQRG